MSNSWSSVQTNQTKQNDLKQNQSSQKQTKRTNKHEPPLSSSSSPITNHVRFLSLKKYVYFFVVDFFRKEKTFIHRLYTEQFYWRYETRRQKTKPKKKKNVTVTTKEHTWSFIIYRSGGWLPWIWICSCLVVDFFSKLFLRSS